MCIYTNVHFVYITHITTLKNACLSRGSKIFDNNICYGCKYYKYIYLYRGGEKKLKNNRFYKKSDSQTIEEVKKAENIIHLEYK